MLGIKATGVDKLDAKVLKRKPHEKVLTSKLTSSFNEWFQMKKIPKYVKTGALLNLSKDSTAFPKVGQIRTISMGCGIFKIYETVVLEKLKSEIKRLNLVHPR